MMLRLIAVGIVAFAMLFLRAHIGTDAQRKTVCTLMFGADHISVTAYQPDSSSEYFCGDLPALGRTLIVFDAVEKEVRDMVTEIRIIKDIGEESEKNANVNEITEAYVSPKKYPGGTIVFEHIFPMPGKFIGLVTVTNEHNQRWVSRFPFAVGERPANNLLFYSLAGLGIVVVTGIYVVTLYRTKNTAKPMLNRIGGS
jgi:hypothetical protein